MKKNICLVAIASVAVLLGADAAFAEEAANSGASDYLTPIGIALTMGVAALGGTLSQGKAVSSALEAIGRNPSSGGEVFLPLILGMAFIESLVILSFVIAFSML